MFETSTLANGPASRRFWQTCIGLSGQAVLLGCAVLAPILSPQILPRALFSTMLVTPGPPPPPPGPAVPMVRPRGIRPAPRITLTSLIEPRIVPASTPRIIDEPQEAPSIGVPGGVEGGERGGVPGAVLRGIMDAGTAPAAPLPRPVPTAAPPEPPAPAVPKRVVLGGNVKPAETIFRPDPPYPPLARQARVSGTVELIGVIGTDGRMRELRVVSGHPLLARAALETVSKWIYKPTLLNGEPVEVIAPITVTFHLN